MKLAFYTCFYGSEKNPAFAIPKAPSSTLDCFYYTNNQTILNALQNTGWIGVWDDIQTTDDIIEAPLTSAKVRVMPSVYKDLKKYDYTCFLDSKLQKVNEAFVKNFINKFFIQQNYALLLREHWCVGKFGGNIWEEAYVSMGQSRYRLQWQKFQDYIKSQLTMGLSDTTEKHCATGLLIRNMKHERAKELETVWWNHLQQCGPQGQITFFFVKQLFKGLIHPFKENPFVTFDNEPDFNII